MLSKSSPALLLQTRKRAGVGAVHGPNCRRKNDTIQHTFARLNSLPATSISPTNSATSTCWRAVAGSTALTAAWEAANACRLTVTADLCSPALDRRSHCTDSQCNYSVPCTTATSPRNAAPASAQSQVGWLTLHQFPIDMWRRTFLPPLPPVFTAGGLTAVEGEQVDAVSSDAGACVAIAAVLVSKSTGFRRLLQPRSKGCSLRLTASPT